MKEWVEIEKGMPPKGTYVFVVGPNCYSLGRWDGQVFRCCGGFSKSKKDVTHWMPTPDRPHFEEVPA